MIVFRPHCALIVCALVSSCQTLPKALALNELQKLKAADAANGDGFGYAVGLGSSNAVVGAWKDNDGGLDAGSAYFFQRAVGGSWVQLDKVTASDAAPGDTFGTAAAISGSTAIIGAPLDDGHGSAYIFRDGGGWNELDKLIADDAASGDQFGFSVAISGNRAVVGAWMDGGGIGSAYIFRDNGVGVWNQVDKISALDAAAGQRFGYSVAISGNRAIIGAPFDSGAAPLAGAAYVFQEDVSGNWNQIDKITADDAAFGLRLGTSVALNSTHVIAGAIGDSSGEPLAGAAYVFQPSGMDWEQVDKLTASDGAAGDRFGQSVALGETTAVVGAHEGSSAGVSAGSAYMFQSFGADNWHQIAKLNATDRALGDELGFAVGASGSTALVGAPFSNGGADSGAAYLYTAPLTSPGDFNDNGVGDAADYTVWRDTFGQTGANLQADGNGDGVVNQADYQLWKETFGFDFSSGGGASIGAVPEPSTATLLYLIAALCGPGRFMWERAC